MFVGGGLFWVPKTMGTTSERRTIKVGNGTFAIHKKVRQKAFMPIFAFHGTTTLFMAFPWVRTQKRGCGDWLGGRPRENIEGC